MLIENAQFTSDEKTTIRATVDGQVWFIPVSAGNRHYDQIIDEGLEIAEPDAD
jgi:hypothetical protein